MENSSAAPRPKKKGRNLGKDIESRARKGRGGQGNLKVGKEEQMRARNPR